MKFKVGDKVAAYGHSGCFFSVRAIGKITEIKDNLVWLESNESTYQPYDPDSGGWDLTLVHSKSCRKIKQGKEEK